MVVSIADHLTRLAEDATAELDTGAERTLVRVEVHQGIGPAEAELGGILIGPASLTVDVGRVAEHPEGCGLAALDTLLAGLVGGLGIGEALLVAGIGGGRTIQDLSGGGTGADSETTGGEGPTGGLGSIAGFLRIE